MRKLFLKSMLLLCALIVGSSSMWAAEGDIHDMSITQSTNLNNNASIPSVNIDEQSYSIKKVTINWRYNKTTENPVTIEVIVGGNSWGTETISGNKTDDVEFSGSSTTGAVVINFTNNTGSGTGHGTFYVNSVKLTEGTSSAPSKVSTPTFSPAAGAVAYGTEVSINCATADATIHYTTNGSNPTSSSTTYSSPITITDATTIKALAVKDGISDSEIATAAYTIAAPEAPSIDVPSGTIVIGTTVTITGTGTIRYAFGNTAPTASTGTEYTGPLTINENCKLQAICVDGGGNESSVTVRDYGVVSPVAGYDINFEAVPAAYSDWSMTNVERSTSAITAHGGTYYGTTGGKATASIQTKAKYANPGVFTCYVSKTTSNTTSSTWYIQVSSDGSEWTNAGTKSATSMTAGSWEKFSADLSSYSNVYVRLYYNGSTAVRTVDDISLTERKNVATPTFSVAAGTYTSVQSVTISCATTGAAIYYTLNGTDPTSSSTLYSSTLSIDESCTLKAIAIKGDDESDVASAAYTINLPTNYTLATAISSGKKYVIVGKNVSNYYVMGTQTSDYRNQVAASYSNGVLSASGACEVTIQGPDASGYYTIYDKSYNDNKGGFLYAPSSSSNYLRSKESIEAGDGYWEISFDGETGLASIVAQGSNTRNDIRYNNGSTRFSCYAAETSQAAVYLYEKDGDTPAATETVEVGATGWASYSSLNPLNLASISGGTAYYSSAASGSTVTLKSITASVPAREGLMIKADEPNSTVTITIAASGTAISGNLLKPGLGDDVAASGSGSPEKYHYVFGYVTENPTTTYGFYNLASAAKVSVGKAYLETESALSAPIGAPAVIRILDEENNATSFERIDGKNDAIKFIENGQLYILREGVVYDALGRKVR